MTFKTPLDLVTKRKHPKETLRLGDDSKELPAALMSANQQFWNHLDKNNTHMSSMLEQMQKQLEEGQEKLKKMQEQLKQLEDNAKSPSPNKILTYIAGGSVTVLLPFYALIVGLASLKHKQKNLNGHKGVLASAVLAAFGVNIAIFIIVSSIYSSTNLLRTRFMKFCLWFFGGISIVALVLLAFECFGSVKWRLFVWTFCTVLWLLAGILWHMMTSSRWVLPVSMKKTI